jgi:hypothetical protein
MRMGRTRAVVPPSLFEVEHTIRCVVWLSMYVQDFSCYGSCASGFYNIDNEIHSVI